MLTTRIVRIPYRDFASYLDEIFERVLREGETVVIGADGDEVVTLRPGEPDIGLPRDKTKEDFEAFLESIDSWSDVDTDRLLADIRASRKTSHPPIDL